jgi:hypothetical protein
LHVVKGCKDINITIIITTNIITIVNMNFITAPRLTIDRHISSLSLIAFHHTVFTLQWRGRRKEGGEGEGGE